MKIVRVSLLPGISQCVIGRVGLVLQLSHLCYIDQSQSWLDKAKQPTRYLTTADLSENLSSILGILQF